MLNEQEINKVVESVIDLWKKANPPKGFAMKRDEVDYYDGYTAFWKWKRSIAVHSVKGTVPVEMISIKAPCQSDEELKYVLSNYKQITLPIPEEFLNTISRGMHTTNWSIEYSEDEAVYVNSDNTLQQYLEETISYTPLSMSFESWWKAVLPSIKINDSMGVVPIKPWRQERVTTDEVGNEVIAGDELPEPIPYYYATNQVLSPLDAPYYLIDTGERSMVEYGGKMQQIGFIYELYDDKAIYRITQTGKFIENKFDTSVWFEHNLGFIPVTRLKGRPAYKDGQIVWQSPLLMVTDILDEAILDNINLRSIKASSTYPQKVTLGNPCRHSENYNGVFHTCDNGYILNADGVGFHKCTECKGSGLEYRTSPLNTILVQPKNDLTGTTGDQIKPSEALAYISPSTETPVLLRQEVVDSLARAKEVLHLKTTNSVVKGAEDMTATGMALDEKAKYAFLSLPVDQIFDIGEFLIRCIGGMRYGKDFKMPTINRPISYDFNTEQDYLNQIGMAQKLGVSPSIVQGFIVKYLKAAYYDDARVARIYDLIIATDRLLPLSQDDINLKLSRNLIAPWEVVLHDSARSIINDLIAKDESFLDQDMELMRTQLIEAAQALVPQSPTVRALNVNSILGNANGVTA